MDNTKDLIKEHLAKIVAEEICKDQNVLEELKAEVLKDLLPTKTKEEATKTDQSELNVSTMDWTKNNESQTIPDLLEKEPTEKSPFDSLTEAKKLLDAINEDLKKLHKEQSKKENDFKFNPDGLPDWYKTKDRSKKPFSFDFGSLDFPKFKGFQGSNTIPVMRDLFNKPIETPKPAPVVKTKPVDDILENFIKEHTIPSDVAEILEKSKKEKPKIKRAARITVKPARKKAKKK